MEWYVKETGSACDTLQVYQMYTHQPLSNQMQFIMSMVYGYVCQNIHASFKKYETEMSMTQCPMYRFLNYLSYFYERLI